MFPFQDENNAFYFIADTTGGWSEVPGKQKACEIMWDGGAFAEVFGIVYPPREGLDRHSPGFTFLNLGVTALSEDSTEATSPAEINKDWHTEFRGGTSRQEEGTS